MVTLQISAPWWWGALGFAALAIALAAVLRIYLRGRDVWRYDPKAAWLRALTYFACCWAIACATGAIGTILTNPVVFPGQSSDRGWWVFTIVVVVIIFVGYWVLWPMGTLAHGRRVTVDTVVFAVLWGASEGLLFASVWAFFERLLRDLPLGGLWVALATIVVLSAFIGLWHALYWDINVAPEHNIAEWNIRKVAFAHNPNVLLTTTYVTLYGNLAIYAGLQFLALFGSTMFMRFPQALKPLPPDPLGPSLGAPAELDLREKTAVITGGANGIGRAVAREYAGLGAHVVIIDIDESGARTLADELGDDTRVITGDLADFDDVRRIASQVLVDCPRVDVMVVNAGIFTGHRTLTPTGQERTMAVNHLGHYLLLQLLNERLQDSDSRVLVVSSDAHRQAKASQLDDLSYDKGWDASTDNPTAGFAAYNRSKLVATACAMELAQRTRDTGMTVNVLTPGAMVVTGIYRDLTGPMGAAFRLLRPIGRSPEEAAQTYVYLAASPEVAGVTGWYWKDRRPTKESQLAQDPAVRSETWQWSREQVGLEP